MKMLSWITSTLLCMGFLLHMVMFSNFLGYDLMFSFLGIVFSGTFVYTGMLNFVGVDIIWVKLMLKSFLMMEVLMSISIEWVFTSKFYLFLMMIITISIYIYNYNSLLFFIKNLFKNILSGFISFKNYISENFSINIEGGYKKLGVIKNSLYSKINIYITSTYWFLSLGTLKMLKHYWNLLKWSYLFLVCKVVGGFSSGLFNLVSFPVVDSVFMVASEGHLFSLGGLKFLGYNEDPLFEFLMEDLEEFFKLVGSVKSIYYLRCYMSIFEGMCFPVDCALETLILLKGTLMAQDFTHQDLLFWVTVSILIFEWDYWKGYFFRSENMEQTPLYDFMISHISSVGFSNFTVIENFFLVSSDDSLTNHSFYVYTSGDFTIFCAGVLNHYYDDSMEKVSLDFLNVSQVQFSSVVFLLPISNPKKFDVHYSTEVNGISLTPYSFMNFPTFDCCSFRYSVLLVYGLIPYMNFGSEYDFYSSNSLGHLSSSSKFGIVELNCSLNGFLVLGDGKWVVEGAILKNTSYNLSDIVGSNSDSVYVVWNHLEEGELKMSLGEDSFSKDLSVLDCCEELGSSSNGLNFFDKTFFMGKTFNLFTFYYYVSYVFKGDDCAMSCWTYKLSPFFNSESLGTGLESIHDSFLDEINDMKMSLFPMMSDSDKDEGLKLSLSYLESGLKIISFYLSSDEMSLGVYVCRGDFKESNCHCSGLGFKSGNSVLCLCSKEYFIEGGLFKETPNFWSPLELPPVTFVTADILFDYLGLCDFENKYMPNYILGVMSELKNLLLTKGEYNKDPKFWGQQLGLSYRLSGVVKADYLGDLSSPSGISKVGILRFNKELCYKSGVDSSLFDNYQGLMALQSSLLEDRYINSKVLISILSNCSEGEILDGLTSKQGPLDFPKFWEEVISKQKEKVSKSSQTSTNQMEKVSLEIKVLDSNAVNFLKLPTKLHTLPTSSACFVMSELVKSYGEEDLKYLAKLEEFEVAATDFFDQQFTEFFLSSLVFLLEFKKLNLTEEEMSKVSLSNSGNTPASFLKDLDKKEVSVGGIFKELFKKLFNKSYHMKDYYIKYGWDKFSPWKSSGSIKP